MIVCLIWQTERPFNEKSKIVSDWKGWFLFGFIPLFIVQMVKRLYPLES